MADNKTVADLPTKNAAPAEPAKSLQATVQQVMNKAITSPTDAKVDFAQGVNHITGDPQQKSAGAADPMPTLKAEKEAEWYFDQSHAQLNTLEKSLFVESISNSSQRRFFIRKITLFAKNTTSA